MSNRNDATRMNIPDWVMNPVLAENTTVLDRISREVMRAPVVTQQTIDESRPADFDVDAQHDGTWRR